MLRRSWGAAAAAVVLVVSFCSTTTVALADETACTDVLVLGARGSGQPQSGAGDDAGTGMGRQVYGVSQRIARRLPGRTVTPMAVVYPAQGVELLAVDPTAYFGGLEQGVGFVRTTLAERATRCPAERIVLSGYSQGAMVVHRALQDLAASPVAAERAILTRVDGAVLISDGDRRRRDRATNVGTAGRSQGIGYAMRADSGARGSQLPAGMRARVQSVCLDLDVICDYKPAFHRGVGGLQGAQIHSEGYDRSRYVNRAADAVAAQIR